MEQESKTLSIVSLICGIAGIILGFIVPILGIILGILAIIFASMAKKREVPNGMRTAGFILGIIALIISVIWIIAVATCLAAIGMAAMSAF